MRGRDVLSNKVKDHLMDKLKIDNVIHRGKLGLFLYHLPNLLYWEFAQHTYNQMNPGNKMPFTRID